MMQKEKMEGPHFVDQEGGDAYAIELKRKKTKVNPRKRKPEILGLAFGNKKKGSQNTLKGDKQWSVNS